MTSETNAFGPHLRYARLKRHITLEEIAARSNVGVDLWDAMERNDFGRWPAGLYARAYIREYAEIVGLDPDATVDEFCRCFSLADRRAERLFRSHAELFQQPLVWQDEVLPEGMKERRASASTTAPSVLQSVRVQRSIAVVMDLSVVCAVAGAMVTTMPIRFWPAVAVTELVYHSVSFVVEGGTPGSWAMTRFASTQWRRERRGPLDVVLRSDDA